MNIQGYNALIERGRRGFAVRFPQLPGLRAYGTTREEAVVMAHETITEFLLEAEQQWDHVLSRMEASGDTSQSVQWLILQAVAETIDGYRCRLKNFELDELPADNIVPIEESDEYPDTTGIERTFRFHVRHLVSTSNNDADQLADWRYVRAQKLLFHDLTLGGLARTVRETGKKWEMESDVRDQMALVITYEVEFSTRRQDPTVPGL